MFGIPLIVRLVVAIITAAQPATAPDGRDRAGEVIFSDDFRSGLGNWVTELESGGTVTAKDGKLEIDVPAGCTVWFKTRLEGDVLIEYDATIIKAGGANDRVSDLNCFWMATDARSATGGLFDIPRSGKFADYNQLRCYYVGYGGNANTTTRFRRYIGSPTTRPILPEHDLSDAKHLLQPNLKMKIQLIARKNLIQYYRDEEKVFEYTDSEPYTKGWFAFRTTQNHMVIENFKVRRLEDKVGKAPAK